MDREVFGTVLRKVLRLEKVVLLTGRLFHIADIDCYLNPQILITATCI